MDLTVNYLAVLVAALASFMIGFLWHGPVFGKTWISLMQITPAQMEKGKKDMEKKMPLYMLLALVQQLVMSFVIAVLCAMTGVIDTASAVMLAVLLWLGIIATTFLNGVLWENKTVPLYVFNLAYHLVNILVITLIVGLWI
jgi:hypothetical protein